MKYVILEFLDDDPLLDNDTVLQSFETKKGNFSKSSGKV